MVYLLLCHKFGTSKIVEIRRDMLDIKEKIDFLAHGRYYREIKRVGGSFREGFRLESSDLDVMYWNINHRVIWELFQSLFYTTHRQSLIICDCSDTPPGYTLLYLLSPTTNRRIERCCVRMNNRQYISSSKFRGDLCSTISVSPVEHGPCASGIHGSTEFDHAHGIMSDFWPTSAYPWLERCHAWPQPEIVHDIVQNGCHFVPVGHKRSKHEHNEWRISFSLAEYKLMCAMNHCQFLTYGLLKLFLKEIINNGLSDDDKLLSSYHMKTAVFWMIQQNTITYWCPQNLLECFWVCFKQVLKWVYEGVCPNFFIPENNMFMAGIYGYAQNNLFSNLHRLYEKGLESLLPFPFIKRSNDIVLRNPEVRINTDDQNIEYEIDSELFKEVHYQSSPIAFNLQGYMRYLQIIEQIISSQFIAQHKVIWLQAITVDVFHKTAFIIQNMNCTKGNKKKYRSDKISCHLLKLAAKFGCISEILYLAIYYYKTQRYSEVLSLIEETKLKDRLKQLYVVYGHIFPDRYSEALVGLSWTKKLRLAVAWDIKFLYHIHYINELVPEQQSCLQSFDFPLFIPPFVLLYMLEILCYIHVDPIKTQFALHDLRTLVSINMDRFVEDGDENISWQILGICQQITGDNQAAINSYQESI
ncbi:uncharacterized protein LOC134256584, partial [Saccostrea cucullata]|uniref:uncharacterized protein LOC134256584 n=1 Tax=Saccostrea cuccullata TaxID=36930 RepID=UPI002ED1D780